MYLIFNESLLSPNYVDIEYKCLRNNDYKICKFMSHITFDILF